MLVLEPLNYTARYFMKLASLPRRLRHRQLGRPAPLCDIVNWQTSIYSVISEYLASLLDGSAPRLVLLWGVEFDSFSDWCDAHPELLALLRRGATTAMLWFEERGLSRVMKAPWNFARLADPHLSDEIKTATILSLFQAPPEQLDGLFSARLVSYFRKIKVDPLELLKSQWTVPGIRKESSRF